MIACCTLKCEISGQTVFLAENITVRIVFEIVLLLLELSLNFVSISPFVHISDLTYAKVWRRWVTLETNSRNILTPCQ